MGPIWAPYGAPYGAHMGPHMGPIWGPWAHGPWAHGAHGPHPFSLPHSHNSNHSYMYFGLIQDRSRTDNN